MADDLYSVSIHGNKLKCCLFEDQCEKFMLDKINI